MAHHGELVQGSFPCEEGVVPALVTVPLPQLHARAEFHPWRPDRADAPPHPQRPRHPDGTGGHHHPVHPRQVSEVLDPGHGGVVDRGGVRAEACREKAARAAGLTLRLCRSRGLPAARGGELRIASDIPPGCGMGSSTADVVAAVRAVADAHGLRLSPREVSDLARRAETACDPLAHGRRPVLFAQRHARVIRSWHRGFPPVLLVGCHASGGLVDILALGAPEHTARERRECARILHRLERAVVERDARLLGQAATCSALLNQARLPKPELVDLLEICRDVGGVGVQIAHSGTACAVMVDARRPDAVHRARDARTALDELGLPRTVETIWRNA